MPSLKYIFSFFIFMICSFVQAKELQVQDRNKQYKLTYEKSSIKFSAIDVELSLVEKKCNVHIIKRFQKSMDDLFSTPFLNKRENGFIVIKIGNETFYEPRTGQRGEVLISMFEQIKVMKVEESLNCN